ncbi:MAG: patatin-like phospholipase family protein [Actinomycetia bacterium]|nr:patatin-like phospholipase family protein [Actinomycetes bacterium]
MSTVGLVLGGGGITGAAFHFGTLLAIEMATGWNPNDAEVIVGTSSGAFVAAMIRADALHLDTFAGTGETQDEIHEWLDGYLYRRGAPRGAIRWIRKGLLPAFRKPNLYVTLGSPGLYRTDGLIDWVKDKAGDLATSWPHKPTVIVAYDLEARRRMPFGTEIAPDVGLAEAVAASSAVPFVYEPVLIDSRWYADGGLASGTSADLLLAHEEPLDLVLVVAPLAATTPRKHGRFFEDVFDRAGRTALASELARIRDAWPDTEVLVLRPDERVLDIARPNPMSVGAAIPAFLTTLRSMRFELAHPSVWKVLERHLVASRLLTDTG